MQSRWQLESGGASSRKPRRGIVRAEGKVLSDDTGVYHPLGNTFFWAMQGYRDPAERPRMLKHLDYLAAHGIDDIRILLEVDWLNRSIDPVRRIDPISGQELYWNDWESVLAGVVDATYDRGMRTQPTIIGGNQVSNSFSLIVNRLATVVRGREEKFFGFEIVNEWFRLNKMSMPMMEEAGKLLRSHFPFHLIALSTAVHKKRHDDTSGFEAMFAAMKRSGADLFWMHPRRSDMEFGWDHVSQSYDFRTYRGGACNGEPEGPQSSVASESRELFIATARALTIICGAARYVFHPGQMVTGKKDDNHGRPENLWEVPNIEPCLRAVRSVDSVIPLGVENWHVANNRRDVHPMPLPDEAFWSDEHYPNGWVNKNYSAIAPNGDFVCIPMGLRSDVDGQDVPSGYMLHRSKVTAYHPVTQLVRYTGIVERGDPLRLPGMRNTESAYIVLGSRV